MKKLFQNYNYEFTKNETKLLNSFCKQTLKQMEGNNQYFAETKAFYSILNKADICITNYLLLVSLAIFILTFLHQADSVVQ